MPNTKDLTCDEHLLAERYLASDPYRYSDALFLRKLTDIARSPLRHNYMHATRFYAPINKYEGAFLQVLSRRRCRARKTRFTIAIPEKNLAVMDLLGSWLNENVQEQAETWKRLEPALEENRSSSRKLFS